MTLLATDVNNPEFTGAVKNPDSALYVEFYMYAPVNKWASDQKSYEEGRKVEIRDPEVPFVRIARPGDQLSIIEERVREDHKRRFPDKWLAFAVDNNLIQGEFPVEGWKLDEWDHINVDQLRELKHKRFQTVEQLANASDASLQGLGMMGQGLRVEARKALNNRIESRVAEANAKKDQEIAELKKQMEDMQKTMQTMMESKPVTGKPKAKRK